MNIKTSTVSTVVKKIVYVVTGIAAAAILALGLGSATANAATGSEGFAAQGEVSSSQAAKVSGLADKGAVSSAAAADVRASDALVVNASGADVITSYKAVAPVCAQTTWAATGVDGGTSPYERFLATQQCGE